MNRPGLALGQVHVGDCMDLLRLMPDESINCCVSSPPYFGLRDYNTAKWEGGDSSCEHKGRPKPRQDTSGGTNGRFSGTRGTQPAKAFHSVPVRATCTCGALRVDQQIGLEETPEEYVEKIVEVFREVRRVLRTDGTCWINVGDTFASNAGQATRGGPPSRSSTLEGNGHRGGGPKLRALGGVSRAVSSGLAPKQMLGIPWRLAFALQADGWWLRMDIIWHKPQPMPESVTDRPTKAHEYVFLLTKAATYWYDADAIKEKTSGNAHSRGSGVSPKAAINATGAKQNASFAAATSALVETRNKRSVWTIPTEANPAAHFATFPEALVTPCVFAGCPVGGVVLDPFAGTATVARVAEDLGRKWVMLELNPEYAAMARRRMRQQGLLGRAVTP